MVEVASNGRRRSQTILVTGATAGIGFATAAGLAELGHAVLITGRDEERGRRATEAIGRRSGNGEIHFLQAEHASVGGNLDLARRLRERVERLDVLVNNVGGIYTDRWETEDGYEGTLAINFVGPFALTQEIVPLLRQGGGRCVNVVSSAFAMVRDDPFADLHSREQYVAIGAYARAKLLNVLWAQALAAREPALAVYLVNPGMAWTPSIQHLQRRAVPAWRLVWPLVRWFQRRASPETAARAPIHVVSADSEAASGTYFDEKSRPEPPPESVAEPSKIQRAWALGETLAASAPTAAALRQ